MGNYYRGVTETSMEKSEYDLLGYIGIKKGDPDFKITNVNLNSELKSLQDQYFEEMRINNQENT